MALGIAASMAFATPMATPPNTSYLALADLLSILRQSRRSDVRHLLDRLRHHYPDLLAILMVKQQ